MQITIKLYAGLRSYLREHTNGVSTLDIPEGSTAGSVLSGLGVPERMPRIIQINGAQRDSCDALADGDVLSVFPPMAGG